MSKHLDLAQGHADKVRWVQATLSDARKGVMAQPPELEGEGCPYLSSCLLIHMNEFK